MLDRADDGERLVWARIKRAIEAAAGAAIGRAKLNPRRASAAREDFRSRREWLSGLGSS
jgi:hypothetical protein